MTVSSTLSESIVAAKNHIKLGKTLQGQGLEILKKIKTLRGDHSTLVKLMNQASATIEKGTKIERESYRELISLEQTGGKS